MDGAKIIGRIDKRLNERGKVFPFEAWGAGAGMGFSLLATVDGHAAITRAQEIIVKRYERNRP